MILKRVAAKNLLEKEEAREQSELTLGTQLNKNRRLQSKSLILIYEGLHIPGEEYRPWIQENVISKHCDGDITKFELFHRTGSPEDEDYKRTYIILSTSEMIGTRKSAILKWGEINPEVRTLKCASQIQEAIIYLRELCSDKKSEKILAIPDKKMTKNPPPSVRRYHGVELMYTSDRPLPFYVSDFLGWQVEALDRMDKNSALPVIECNRDESEIISNLLKHQNVIDLIAIMSKNGHRIILGSETEEKNLIPMNRLREKIGYANRNVHVVYDPKGNTGKTVFLKAIKRHDPNRFLIIEDVPQHEYYLAAADGERKRGWNGDCVIFNLSRQCKKRRIHKTIERALDEFTCRNVWIFTNWMPEIEELSLDRWKFYKITSNWSKNQMSPLELICTNDAHDDMMHEASDRRRRAKELR